MTKKNKTQEEMDRELLRYLVSIDECLSFDYDNGTGVDISITEVIEAAKREGVRELGRKIGAAVHAIQREDDDPESRHVWIDRTMVEMIDDPTLTECYEKEKGFGWYA